MPYQSIFRPTFLILKFNSRTTKCQLRQFLQMLYKGKLASHDYLTWNLQRSGLTVLGLWCVQILQRNGNTDISPHTGSWLYDELGPLWGTNYPSLCVTTPRFTTDCQRLFPHPSCPDLYYIAFPKDRLICKCLVYGVCALETLQTVIITHDAFASFGRGFGSFEALDNIQLTCLSIPFLSGIGASQNFPAHTHCPYYS